MLPLEILKGPIHLTEGENCLRIIKVWVNNLRIVFLLPPYAPYHWLTVFGRRLFHTDNERENQQVESNEVYTSCRSIKYNLYSCSMIFT